MMGRKTLLGFANLAVGVVFGLVALKLTAIYFGREAFGTVEFTISVLGILYLITDLNMGEAHVKRVSEGGPVGDYFVTFAVFKLVSTLVFVAVASAGLWLYAGALGKPLVSTSISVIIILMGYYVAKSMAAVAQSTFEARREAALGQVGSVIETLIRVGMTTILAFTLAALVHRVGPMLGWIQPDNVVWRWVVADPAAALALTFTVSAIVNAVISLMFILRSLEPGRFQWAILRSYWAYALPLFVVSSVSIISTYIDRVALGFFGGSVDTADFGGFRRIILVIEGVGVAVSLLLFPTLSSLAAQNDREGIQSIMDRTTRYLSILIVPLCAFLVAFPSFTISLVLGNEWLGSRYTLSLLAIWILIVTLARPYLNLLMGMNKPGVAARIGVTVSLLNIVLNLILIPEDIQSIGLPLFGLKAFGAALATLISGIVYYVMLRYATRELGVYHPRVALWKHFLAGGFMMAVLALMDLYGPLPLVRWFSLPAYAVVGALAYGGALILLRELDRADYEYVIDVVHPGEMWRYIKSELRGKSR